MKKIVMLTCLKANTVCTGAGCLRAFNERTSTFSRYEGEALELQAFFRCNGCGVWDDGMEEKLERLISLRPDAVHLGVCTKGKDGVRCPTIARIAQRLEQEGAQIVDGTH
jgi:predicted metal-binding protein